MFFKKADFKTIDKLVKAMKNLNNDEKIYGSIGNDLFLEVNKSFAGLEIIVWKGNYHGFFAWSSHNQYIKRIFYSINEKLIRYLYCHVEDFENVYAMPYRKPIDCDGITVWVKE